MYFYLRPSLLPCLLEFNKVATATLFFKGSAMMKGKINWNSFFLILDNKVVIHGLDSRAL